MTQHTIRCQCGIILGEIIDGIFIWKHGSREVTVIGFGALILKCGYKSCNKTTKVTIQEDNLIMTCE